MTTRGTVVRLASGTAWVRVCHGEYCGGCGMHSADDEFVEVEVQDSIGTQVGDKVEFESDTARMIRTVFLVFWFPLVAAGLLAWVGWQLAAGLALAPKLGAGVLAAAGLACAIAVVRGVEKRAEAGAGLTIARVVSEDELPCRASNGTEDARVG